MAAENYRGHICVISFVLDKEYKDTHTHISIHTHIVLMIVKDIALWELENFEILPRSEHDNFTTIQESK